MIARPPGPAARLVQGRRRNPAAPAAADSRQALIEVHILP
jgi:hypothetical protein